MTLRSRFRVRTVRRRLQLGFGLTIVALFAAGLVGIRALTSLRRDVQTDVGAVAAIENQLFRMSDATLRQVVMSQAQMMGAGRANPVILDSLAFLSDSLRRALVTGGGLGQGERARLETMGALQGRTEVYLAMARAYVELGRTADAFRQGARAARALDTLLITSARISRNQLGRLERGLNRVDRLVRQRRLALGGLLLAGLAMATLFGWMTWRSVTRPIDALVRRATALGKGDLRVEAYDDALESEFRAVVAAFEDNTVRLRELINEIIHEAKALNDAARALNATSAQAAASSGQVGTAVAAIAHDADVQRHQVEESRESLRAVAGATDLTEASAGQARDVAHGIRDTTAGTSTKIAQTVQLLHQSQDILRQSSEQIGELDTASRAIDQFIQVVRHVADQTELLSLNASIEAARAKEHGRGFAVVAEEVRTLAANSTEAAIQVDGVVRSIRKQLTATIGAFENGVRKLGNVGEASEATSDALREIEQAVARVDEVTTAIDRAAAKSRDATAHVREHLETIGLQAEQQAAASEEAAAATEETAASSEEVSATATQVQQTAERLLALVQRFKV